MTANEINTFIAGTPSTPEEKLKGCTELLINNQNCVVLEVRPNEGFFTLLTLGFDGTETRFRIIEDPETNSVEFTIFYSNGRLPVRMVNPGRMTDEEQIFEKKRFDIVNRCIRECYNIKSVLHDFTAAREFLAADFI